MDRVNEKFSIKNINLEIILIAFAQLVGFASFFFVIYDAPEETLKLFAIFIASQAASSFLLMAVQFSPKRGSILTPWFIYFLVFYFSFVFLLFRGSSGTNFIYEFFTVFIFLFSTFIQLSLTALKKYINFLWFQLFFSFLLPFVVLIPIIIFSFVFIYFIFIWKNLNLSKLIKKSNFSNKDIKNWVLVISLQAPFVLFPFFDPFLADRIDIKLYEKYLLYGKFIFGVLNFSFSFFQFKLIKGEILKLDFFPFFILFSLVILTSTSFYKVDIFFQIILFAFIVNSTSLYLRSMMENSSSLNVFVSIISILGYFMGLRYFSDIFFMSENNLFIIFLSFCISFSAIFLWFTSKTVKQNPKL